MSLEDVVRDALYNHGFLESNHKPGLFFNKVSEDATVYADFRGGKQKFYGFIKDEERLPPEVVEKHVRRLRQALSAMGCETLKDFGVEGIDEKIERLPKDMICANPDCRSMSYLRCPHCSALLCKSCGGTLEAREEQ